MLQYVVKYLIIFSTRTNKNCKVCSVLHLHIWFGIKTKKSFKEIIYLSRKYFSLQYSQSGKYHCIQHISLENKL